MLAGAPSVIAVIVALLVAAPAGAASAKWSTPRAISTGDPVPAGTVPSVAEDSAGDAAAVWTTSTGQVRVALRTAGAKFAAPLTVPAGPGDGSPEHARVAMDPAGDALVAWDDAATGDVYLAARAAGGAFTAPAALGAGHGPAVQMSNAGDAVIAFQAGGAVDALRRSAAGALSAPDQVSAAGDTVTGWSPASSLSVSPDGNAAIAFAVCPASSTCTTGNAAQIVTAVASPGAAFAAPVAASSSVTLGATSSVRESSVAIDDAGDIATAFAATGASGTNAEVATADAGSAATVTLNQPGSSPAVALDASRETVATWTASTGSGLDAAVRAPGGGFGAATELATQGHDPALAVANASGGNGQVLAIWLGAASGHSASLAASVRAAGSSFPAHLKVASTSSGATTGIPVAATLNASGAAAAVWLTSRGIVDAGLLAAPSKNTTAKGHGGVKHPVAPAATALLKITRHGTGQGTVTSSDAKIQCGRKCTHRYRVGTRVTLSAKGATGSKFTGWSGACSGSSHSCAVTVSRATTVAPKFEKTTSRSSAHGKHKKVQARVRLSRLSAKRRDRLSMQLNCSKAACSGTVVAFVYRYQVTKVKRHGKRVKVRKQIKVVIAQGTFTLRSGHGKRLTLTLNATGRKRLTKQHRLTVNVHVTITGHRVASGKLTVRI